MHQSAIILYPKPGWAKTVLQEVSPGAHVAVLTALTDPPLEGRRAGLVMRDSLLVIAPHQAWTLFLFRSPLREDTVAANVLIHGVGGIHIAACHVGDDVRVNQPCGSPDNAYSGGWNTNPMATLTTGRWPTNLLCVHPDGCKIVGRTKIRVGLGRADGGEEIKGKYTQTYALGISVRSTTHHGENGWEEVDMWECQPDCTLTEINDQSEEAGRFYPQLHGEAGLLAWVTALITPPGTTPLVM
jgi:hypothetical protein